MHRLNLAKKCVMKTWPATQYISDATFVSVPAVNNLTVIIRMSNPNTEGISWLKTKVVHIWLASLPQKSKLLFFFFFSHPLPYFKGAWTASNHPPAQLHTHYPNQSKSKSNTLFQICVSRFWFKV